MVNDDYFSSQSVTEIHTGEDHSDEIWVGCAGKVKQNLLNVEYLAFKEEIFCDRLNLQHNKSYNLVFSVNDTSFDHVVPVYVKSASNSDSIYYCGK